MADRRLIRIAAVSGAALLFGLLLIAVRVRWLPLESVDGGVAGHLNSAISHHPAWVRAMKVISWLGSSGFLLWTAGAAAAVLALRRRFVLAAYLVVASAGAPTLDYALKLAVGRLRPVVHDPVAFGGGNSFPSGHSLSSIVIYGALVLVFGPALPARKLVVAVVAVLVAAIGFSRLALGVHFLSDVLGAWCLGVAWLGLTAYVFELGRVHEGLRPTGPLAEGLEPEAREDLKPAPVRGTERHPLRSAATAVVGWVTTFGVLVGIGLPLARYRHGNGNILGDHTIPHWLAAHRTPTLDRISQWGSAAGNTHWILYVGLVAGLVTLALTRRWRPVVFLLVTMLGELALFLASSAVVDRARPDVPHLDGQLPTSSYPSGHVAATILLYTSVAVLVTARTRAWWRWVAVALAVVMPLWVALSRMYRGMHHPTDILLGSVVLAALWLATTLYTVRPNSQPGGFNRMSVKALPTTSANRSSVSNRPRSGSNNSAIV